MLNCCFLRKRIKSRSRGQLACCVFLTECMWFPSVGPVEPSTKENQNTRKLIPHRLICSYLHGSWAIPFSDVEGILAQRSLCLHPASVFPGVKMLAASLGCMPRTAQVCLTLLLAMSALLSSKRKGQWWHQCRMFSEDLG